MSKLTAGQATIEEMQQQHGYDPMGEGSVDDLIEYKNAVEDRLIAMVDGAGEALLQIREVAVLPTGSMLAAHRDQLRFAFSKLERIADIATAERPDEEWKAGGR